MRGKHDIEIYGETHVHNFMFEMFIAKNSKGGILFWDTHWKEFTFIEQWVLDKKEISLDELEIIKTYKNKKWI